MNNAETYFEQRTGFPISKNLNMDFVSVTQLMHDYAAFIEQSLCSKLLEFVEKKMKGDTLFAGAQSEETFPTYYNGKIVAYQNVMQFIDELPPIAGNVSGLCVVPELT